MHDISPPCRIYFTLNGSNGKEYASFDLRPYMGAQFAEYELTHHESDIRESANGPHKFVEELKKEQLVGSLRDIKRKVKEIDDHIKWFGWKMKLLPFPT